MRNDAAFDSWKRDVYPKYWSLASRAYGVDSYCAGLLKLVESYSPRAVFELAIGNGFPFAGSLCSKGIDVSGCDISGDLIAELTKEYPEVRGVVGSYDDFEMGDDRKFDVVYCFRSTWYFPDLFNAIEFMLERATPSGVVIFDIMNCESRWNRNLILKKNFLFAITICKNLIKRISNCIHPGRWMVDKVFGIREIMYSPKVVEEFLLGKGLSYSLLDICQVEALADVAALSLSEFSQDQKIVFVVKKSGSFEFHVGSPIPHKG